MTIWRQKKQVNGYAKSITWQIKPNSPSSVGPSDVVVPPATGPPDVSASHVAPCPEVLLPLPPHKVQELPLLRAAVNRDWLHPVVPAKPDGLALGE